jgi:hypothetical protein
LNPEWSRRGHAPALGLRAQDCRNIADQLSKRDAPCRFCPGCARVGESDRVSPHTAHTATAGGGIFNAKHSKLTISFSDVTNNTAPLDPDLDNVGLVKISNSTVRETRRRKETNPSAGVCNAQAQGNESECGSLDR